MSRLYTRIELTASNQVDLERTRIRCEGPGCANELVMADAFSAVIVTLAMPGNRRIASVQCPEEQHFCCSDACMEAAVIACLREHTRPLAEAYRARLEEAEQQRAQLAAPTSGGEETPAQSQLTDL